MELYLHVRVLISIILGLSVTHLVGGAATFMQHPRHYRVSLIHLAWSTLAFLSVIFFWRFEFRLSLVQQWSFGLYLFIVIYSSMYYFLIVRLFLNDIIEYEGYRGVFIVTSVWFLALSL